MNLLIALNPMSEVPLQRQLYDEFRRMILSRELAAGQKVPSTRELARSLGISRTTVTASYDYLLSEGYLEAAAGSGTYVSRKLPEELLSVDVAAELLATGTEMVPAIDQSSERSKSGEEPVAAERSRRGGGAKPTERLQIDQSSERSKSGEEPVAAERSRRGGGAKPTERLQIDQSSERSKPEGGLPEGGCAAKLPRRCSKLPSRSGEEPVAAERSRRGGGAKPTERLQINRPTRSLHEKLSWYGASLETRQWLSFADEEPEIQFSFGRPDFEHFPMAQWMQLVGQYARRRSLSVLDYPSRAQGYLPLRQALSSYLIRSRALHCDPAQIIVVNGSQQAIDLVCRVLIDRGDLAAIEEPGYLGAQRALIAQGAEIAPIPVDQDGLKVEELKKRSREDARHLKMVYVTPSHQFPTGVVMSLPRRLDLLSWADKYGTFIIEDDYDSEYRYKGRPIPALAGLTHKGSVIYIGTFSKVLMPALRLGYLVVPEHLITVFSRAKWLADRHSPLLEQQALADFIKLGHMERHVRRMRALYERKRKLVVQSLGEMFGSNAVVRGDNAGINVLVRFNTLIGDSELEGRALARGVGITSTRQEYLTGGRPGEFLLNYGGLSEEQIVRGLSILAEIVCGERNAIV